jgi:hypothetical protein
MDQHRDDANYAKPGVAKPLLLQSEVKKAATPHLGRTTAYEISAVPVP